MRVVFTVASGRCGTGYLRELFENNFDCNAVHEYVGPEDFGWRKPDVGIMRTWNTVGDNQRIRDFWSGKFSAIPTDKLYIETDHTLAKAGLLEHVPDGWDVDVILLKRNWLETARSMKSRLDFTQAASYWLWYLDPDYPRNMMASSAETLNAMIVWYLGEMEVRQEWYRSRFGGRFRFIDANLEDITTREGAEAFLKHWEHSGKVSLPGKINSCDHYAFSDDSELQALVGAARENFDPVKFAKEYLEIHHDKNWEVFKLPECEDASPEVHE